MSAPYLGDFPASGKVFFLWNTSGQDGASITRSTDGTLKIYKGNTTAATWITERTSLNGVTQTEDFDGSTGVHAVAIDLSDNTDAGFYAAGNEYQVVMTGMTIDTKTVNAVIASFSIEREGGVLALLKGTDGLTAIKTDTDTIRDDIETVTTGVEDRVIAVQGVTDKLDTALEVDGGVYRFTTNALEQAPTGGGATAAQVADAVWDEAEADHVAAGSMGKQLGDIPTSAAPTAQAIAEAVLTLAVAGVEVAADKLSLATAILKLLGKTVRTPGNDLQIYQTDGATVKATQALTADPTGQPISAVGKAA